jgi:hypothetical protein
MQRRSRHAGAGLVLVALFLLAVFASLAAIATGMRSTMLARERGSERALAQAREALIAYAADRPITTAVGPGYLPCPDTDDDGWAEATCGSLSGHLGQAERIGRLPWKTLGLPDLRDGHGERLWYAVSTRHKGLLNCAASRECRDLTPQTALGTITLRDAGGALLHDAAPADARAASGGGAAAVVIAPGPPLTRADGLEQRRECAPGECDALGRCVSVPPQRAARCDPRNYLDVAGGGEDNAAFVDGSRDGFVAGPVSGPDGTRWVNDRVEAIGYADLMPRVMARVALELAQCLRPAAALPPPEPECATGLGRVADEALAGEACNARATEPAWWPPWKPFVLYARAAPAGLEVVDDHGRAIATRRRFAVIATAVAGECAPERVQCADAGCTRVALRPRDRERPDAVVSMP